MRATRFRRTIAIAALLSNLALSSTALFAQAVAKVDPKEDEVIELSPFTVNASDSESGYLSRYTLSANRVKTDFEDIGASVDLLTSEFLNNVGVQDSADALNYVANMSGWDGRTDNDRNNDSQWYSFAFSSRGFRSDTLMVGFFPQELIPIDRFNTEDLTFLRGPNAILFGIGNPGGSVSATHKRPLMGKDRLTLNYTVGSYGSNRVEVDLNQVLIPNKFAVRVTGLAQDNHVYRSPSLDRRNAFFGAVSFKPFPKTTITANYESWDWTRLFMPNTFLYDAYTPWVLAGRPTVNWKTGAGQTAPGLGKYDIAYGSGLEKWNTANRLLYIENDGKPMQNWKNMAASAVWDNPSVWAADRNNLANTAFTTENNILTTPDGQQWRLDLIANPWSDNNREQVEQHSESVFIEQNIFKGLDLELAANASSVEYYFDSIGTNSDPTIHADPNELLPDGTPNPYVGRPYIESGEQQIKREQRKHKNMRATLVYDIDLDDVKVAGFGLGHHRLLGLWEDQDLDTYLAFGRTVNTTPLAGFITNLTNNQNKIVRRYYLEPGESAYGAGAKSLTGLNLGTGINVDTILAGPVPRHSFKNTESLAAALQSELWRAKSGYYRLVTLYGVRQDKVSTQAMSFTPGANGAYPGDLRNWDSALQSGTWDPETVKSVDTKSYSILLRPIASLSLFYNFSDVFTPNDPAFADIDGNSLRPTYGNTKDYGIKLRFLRDRAMMTLTRFKTVQFDQTFQAPAGLKTDANAIWDSIPGRSSMDLPTFRSYRDDTTEGTELTMVANVTENWRLRISAGHQDTSVTGYADEIQAYIDNHWAEWQANKDVPLATPTAVLRTVGDMADAFQRDLDDLRTFRGSKLRNQSAYSAAVNVNYSFRDSFLKGVSLGGGGRWISAPIVGYQRTDTGVLDLEHPYKGAETFVVDFNIGYRRKLMHNRIAWRIQLNVYNLLDQTGTKIREVVDSADAQHTPIVTRSYPTSPCTFRITNAFEF